MCSVFFLVDTWLFYQFFFLLFFGSLIPSVSEIACIRKALGKQTPEIIYSYVHLQLLHVIETTWELRGVLVLGHDEDHRIV